MQKTIVASGILAAGILAGVIVSGTFSRTESGLAAPPQAAAPATAPAQPAPGATDLTVAAERALRSVANISSTSIVRQPLYRDIFGQQYFTQRQAASLGSGVLVSADGYVLTNAHVVGYASRVEIQASQSGDKIGATVVALARGIDLAVLKLDDESFFDTHVPVARTNALPGVRDAVFAYGYPTGGNSLSITKGIVSRIEFVNFRSGTSGLRIQIDAAINPGNSGGPVIGEDKMIGLAYATGANVQNMGYIIPNEEIEIFLRDVADGRYDGKPAMLDYIQTLENPVLRDYLKLDKSVEGAIVQRPFMNDPAYPLKEWDVVTRIGDSPIDNQAMVKLGSKLRVRFQYRVQQLGKDGKVPLTIIRGGKTMKVQLPMARSPFGLPRHVKRRLGDIDTDDHLHLLSRVGDSRNRAAYASIHPEYGVVPQ